MAERTGVEIDYCPKCRGVWLDRGELDKILERAAAEFGSSRQSDRGDERSRSNQLEELMPPRERRKDEDDESWRQYEKRRRRKRFDLGDIFDF